MSLFSTTFLTVKVVPGGEGGWDAVKLGGGGGLQAPAGLERLVAWVCSEVRPGASLAYIRSLSLARSLSFTRAVSLSLSVLRCARVLRSLISGPCLDIIES